MQFEIPRPIQMGDYAIHSSNGKPIDGVYHHGQYMLDIFSDTTSFLLNNHSGGCFTHAATVVNYTSKPILVVDRWNCLVVIPPCEIDRGHKGCIVIEQVHSKPNYYDKEYVNNVTSEFRDFANGSLKPHMARSMFYIDLGPLDPTATLNLVTWAVIEDAENKLSDYNGAVYMEEFDLCIGSVGNKKHMIHPRSTPDEIMSAYSRKNSDFLSVQFFINDPTYQYSKKFIKLGTEVHEVPVFRLNCRESGIYIVGKDFKGEPYVRRYNLDGKDLPYVLHNSQTEAERENNQAEVDKEIHRLKTEASKIKASADMEVLKEKEIQAREENARKAEERLHEKEKTMKQREADLSEQVRRRKMAEKEAEKIDNERNVEKRSQWRKIILETAKLLTTVITTATTLYAWYKIRSAG